MSKRFTIEIIGWFDNSTDSRDKSKALKRRAEKAVSKGLFGDKLLAWDYKVYED